MSKFSSLKTSSAGSYLGFYAVSALTTAMFICAFLWHLLSGSPFRAAFEAEYLAFIYIVIAWVGLGWLMCLMRFAKGRRCYFLKRVPRETPSRGETSRRSGASSFGPRSLRPRRPPDDDPTSRATERNVRNARTDAAVGSPRKTTNRVQGRRARYYS